MATFVLVHGAWHGGWCWQRVAPLLHVAGHTVYTPTLTGLGERAHLAHAGVDLALHVRDIVAVLEYERLANAILVGHSYGGMVITGVAEQAADRLAHLVYLDAFVPRHGEAVWDLMPPERRAALEQLRTTRPEAWQVPPPDPALWGLTAPEERAWVAPRLVPQPLATFQQPLAAPAYRAAALPRTYIRAAHYAGPFDVFANRAQREPGWRYHALPAGHDVMVTHPRELAALLLALA
jgi:pimeloyl-ACP methyl ester carboxylesterase